MCTVEVPTCRPICIAEVLRKAMRIRNSLNRHNNADPNASFARRALFNDGPVNHERTAQFLARETERIRRDVSARWNFDFETETPLVGRYLWTPVHENPALSTPSSSSSSIEEPVPELVSAAETSSSSHSESTSSRRVVRQKRVTDYMPQRKRPVPSKQRESSPESKIPRRTTTSSSTDTTKA